MSVHLGVTVGDPAGAGAAKSAESPIYLDTAEGLKRLEESRARQSFVPLSMYFVSQETQTFCGVASATMVLNALIPKEERGRASSGSRIACSPSPSSSPARSNRSPPATTCWAMG